MVNKVIWYSTFQLNEVEILDELDGDLDGQTDNLLQAANQNRMKPKRGNLFLRSSRAFNPGNQVESSQKIHDHSW